MIGTPSGYSVGEALAQALGDAGAVLDVDRRQHDEELLAAQPVGELERAQLAAQRRGDLAQHRVAARVAVLVVDALEVVDVEDDERDRLAAQARLLGELAEAVGQASAG